VCWRWLISRNRTLDFVDDLVDREFALDV